MGTNCVTQLNLDTVEKLSSPIFCCLCVSLSGIGNTRSSFRIFNIYRHKSTLLTHYHSITSSCNDPVPVPVNDGEPTYWHLEFDLLIFQCIHMFKNVEGVTSMY